MEKRYSAMWMWLCEGKLKQKKLPISGCRPRATQKRACLSSLINVERDTGFEEHQNLWLVKCSWPYTYPVKN